MPTILSRGHLITLMKELPIDIPEEIKDPRLLLKKKIALEVWGLIVLAVTIVYLLALTSSGGIVGHKLITIVNPILGSVGCWLVAGFLILATFHLLSAARFPVTGRLSRLYLWSIPLILGAVEAGMFLKSFYWDRQAILVAGVAGLNIGRFLRLLFGDATLPVVIVLIVVLAFISLQLNPIILLKALWEISVSGLKSIREKNKYPNNQFDPDIRDILFNNDSEEPFQPTDDNPDSDSDFDSFTADLETTPKQKVRKKSDPPPGSQLDLGLDDAGVIPKPVNYKLPPIELLSEAEPPVVDENYKDFASQRIVKTLDTFGIPCRVIDVITGPAVTRVEVVLGEGIRVNKVEGMEKDIGYILPAKRVRIQAPIPGKTAIGIEFPNPRTNIVRMREIISSKEYQKAKYPLTLALAKDLNNQAVVANLGKMPHLLVAGQTGSGKSVCLHSIIVSLLYRLPPDQLRLILIDPKMVEFGFYDGLPHLLTPVVNDVNDAVNALRWSVQEMRDRYKCLKEARARDIMTFNRTKKPEERMPYIVIVIDEMSDLMTREGFEIEACITSLTQLARAVGIHLVLATQRPSVKVITGNIKGNIPARIALNVASYNDSRTILDYKGAETLLGNGDMLYKPIDEDHPTRAQGAYLDVEEIKRVVAFWAEQGTAEYDDEVTAEHAPARPTKGSGTGATSNIDIDGQDSKLFRDAILVFMNEGEASTSNLQSKLGLGYPRARRLMDQLEELGLIGPKNGSKPREINYTACRKLLSQFENFRDDDFIPDENNIDEILTA